MKRGFTLIEMLVVVALMATLMTIVFRLSSVSSDETARLTTVVRLSAVENCLAGFYAANGGYPPVALHGSRDIYLKIGANGLKTDQRNEDIWGWYDEQRADHGVGQSKDESTAWKQVRAACVSQPMGCAFPFNSQKASSVRKFADELKSRCEGGEFPNYAQGKNPQYDLFVARFDALEGNLGRFNGYEEAISWDELQIFKFGLMSYLLPRFQMMMGGNKDLYNNFAQWTGNNSLPSNPLTGSRLSWEDIVDMNEDIRKENESNKKSTSSTKSNSTFTQRQTLSSIPSQAACARWLPNLRMICTCSASPESESEDTGYIFYGVQVAEIGDPLFLLSGDKNSSPPAVDLYIPPGAGENDTRNCYMLDSVTVNDGWGNELYYYSPTPHQKYQLWSSGKNGRTFPPWIPRNELGQNALKCVAAWTSDDIIGLSN